MKELMEYNIDDRLRPKGRYFSTIIYKIIGKTTQYSKNEILYQIEQIFPNTHNIITDLTNDILNQNYIKIKLINS